MADEESREAGGEERTEGGGYDALSMNVVPAAVTEEQSESGRRAGGVALLVIAVLVVVALAVLGGRFLLNPHPGQEVEDRLRTRLSALPIWQSGLVLKAGYRAGNTVWLEFAPNIRTTMSQDERGERRLVVPSDEQREEVRAATRTVMEILVEERPGRDLTIEGYVGGNTIVTAEYRHKSTLVGPGGEEGLDIAVRVAGDPKGGMGQDYDQSARTRKPE
jgi:hypothetical protein